MVQWFEIALDGQILRPGEKRQKRNIFWTPPIQVDRNEVSILEQGLLNRRARTRSQYTLSELQKVIDLAG
jgi:hypothetical protein